MAYRDELGVLQGKVVFKVLVVFVSSEGVHGDEVFRLDLLDKMIGS